MVGNHRVISVERGIFMSDAEIRSACFIQVLMSSDVLKFSNLLWLCQYWTTLLYLVKASLQLGPTALGLSGWLLEEPWLLYSPVFTENSN